MALVVLRVADAMIRETRLPDGAALIQSVGESSLDELHRPFQGDFFRGREYYVDVVGHDDEFVEEKFLLIAIVREGFDQKSSSRFAAEDWNALEGDGGDKENAVGEHSVMVTEMCERC